MSFESLRDRWANLPLLGRALISLVAAGVLGYAVIEPGYGLFKSWKLSKNLVQAEKAAAAGRMGEARDLSLTVLRGGNSGIEPLRVLEKAAAVLGDPRHGEIAKTLLAHPKSDDEDRWNGFKGIADVVALGVVSQAWATLPPSCRAQSRFAAEFAGRALSENHLPEATAVLLSVPEANRSPEINRLLVRVLIRSGKPEGSDEAQRRITAELPKAVSDRGAWLGVLEQVPPAALREDLLGPVRQALMMPEAAEDGRSQLVLARMDFAAAEEAKRPEILRAAVERWKDREPVLVARFLTELGADEEIAGLFPTAVVAGSLDLQRLVMEALGKTGRWQEMVVLLDAAGQKMPKYEESAFRAVVAANTGDAAGRAQHWKNAVGEAKSVGIPDAVLHVSRIATRFGMPGEGEQGMVEAIRSGRGPLPLFIDLQPLIASLESQERESVLMEIYAIYIPFEPGNPELFTRYAYLACLNRLVEPGVLLEKLELLSKSFPKESMLRWVLATVYLCDGKPEKADEVFARMSPLEVDDHVPGFRIAYLTTEVVNQRIPAEDPRIKDFPWNLLKASERKRFTELIQAAPR